MTPIDELIADPSIGFLFARHTCNPLCCAAAGTHVNAGYFSQAAPLGVEVATTGDCGIWVTSPEGATDRWFQHNDQPLRTTKDGAQRVIDRRRDAGLDQGWTYVLCAFCPSCGGRSTKEFCHGCQTKHVALDASEARITVTRPAAAPVLSYDELRKRWKPRFEVLESENGMFFTDHARAIFVALIADDPDLTREVLRRCECSSENLPRVLKVMWERMPAVRDKAERMSRMLEL